MILPPPSLPMGSKLQKLLKLVWPMPRRELHLRLRLALMHMTQGWKTAEIMTMPMSMIIAMVMEAMPMIMAMEATP